MNFAPPALSSRALAVWRRNFLVWRKLALPSLLGNLADPMIYLFGLGYGLGGLVPEVQGVSYIAFLAAGTVCASTMNAASFEALYSGFSRMHVQRTWEAIMNAPVSLDDVVAGECLWAATKATISGAAILLVIALLGFVSSPLALAALPVIFLTGLCFAALGLTVTVDFTLLRFLHVLLHAVHHAHGLALRGIFPDGSAPGSGTDHGRCPAAHPCGGSGTAAGLRRPA